MTDSEFLSQWGREIYDILVRPLRDGSSTCTRCVRRSEDSLLLAHAQMTALRAALARQEGPSVSPAAVTPTDPYACLE